MNLLTALAGLAIIGIKHIADQSKEANPEEENLATCFDSIIDTGVNVTKREADKRLSEFNRGYQKGKDRYDNMSDEQLKREIERLNGNRGSGYKHAGESRAMREEIDKRKEQQRNNVKFKEIRPIK